VIPRDLLVGSPQFRHAATGVHFSVRRFTSRWRNRPGARRRRSLHVLEDNVRKPSGVSYVIENRRIMTRLMPELIRGCASAASRTTRPIFSASLRELAPCGVTDPTVALLTPGPFNSAFFEHVFLSQQMGIELVEGRDPRMHGPQVVHEDGSRAAAELTVLYRRIDDDFLDPVAFRPDSLLGVAGLTAVLRAGNATLANAIGTGSPTTRACSPTRRR